MTLEDRIHALRRRLFRRAEELGNVTAPCQACPLKAANGGNVEAMRDVRYAYLSGTGLKKDVQQGVVWPTKAAEQGDLKSQDALWKIYWGGWGVKQDILRALHWMERARTMAFLAPANCWRASTDVHRTLGAIHQARNCGNTLPAKGRAGSGGTGPKDSTVNPPSMAMSGWCGRTPRWGGPRSGSPRPGPAHQ